MADLSWYRAMRGKEARKKCPELQLVQVPLTHGKAELGPYRAAGKQVRRLRHHCMAEAFLSGRLKKLVRRFTTSWWFPSLYCCGFISSRLDDTS